MKPGDKRLDYAWEIGYAKMEDGDTRRHKSRCVWHRDGNRCEKRLSMCIGSSHCEYYQELVKVMGRDTQNAPRPPREHTPITVTLRYFSPPKNWTTAATPQLKAAKEVKSATAKVQHDAPPPAKPREKTLDEILTPKVRQAIIEHFAAPKRRQASSKKTDKSPKENALRSTMRMYSSFVGRRVLVKGMGEGVLASVAHSGLKVRLLTGQVLDISAQEVLPGMISIKL